MLNELFRTYKKIIVLFLLLGSGLIFWFFGFYRTAPAEQTKIIWEKKALKDAGYKYEFQTENLKGSLVFGVKGFTVKDKDIPVCVDVTSLNDTFTGVIKISVPGVNSGGVAYQSAVQCEEGATCHATVMVPQLGNASYFVFEILDQYGNVMLHETESPAYSMWVDASEDVDRQICIGVLNSKKEAFSYLDQLTFESDSQIIEIRTVPLDEDDFPTNSYQLNILSAIIIDNYDVSKLSKKQVSTLTSWIKGGGHLIIGTGSTGATSLKYFSDLFQVESGNVDMGRLYFSDKNDFSGEVGLYLNQLKFQEGAGWKMVNWSEPASFYEKSYGEGIVQVLRFSLDDEALRQWNRCDDMLKSLMNQLLEGIFTEDSNKETNLWNIEVALNDFVQSQTPNAFYYGIFFLVYLSFLVFLSYFVLRRQKRREYIWIVVPVLSVFFTCCLLLRSKGSNGVTNQTMQNSISAIRIMDSQKEKNNIYLLYQNAEGEGKTLDLIPAIDSISPLNYEYATEDMDSSRLRKISEDYTVSRTIKGYNISFSEATPGTLRMIGMTENKAMNYGEKTELFKGKIEGDHTAFSGKIKNISGKTFDKILVIRGNEYWIGGKLNADAQITIAAKDVKCWYQGISEEEMDWGEMDYSMKDILQYLSEYYLRDNSKLRDCIVIGITVNDNYSILRGGDTLGNQISAYVNHITLENPEKAECEVNINSRYLTEPKTYDQLMEEFEQKTRFEVNYQFDTDKIVWAMARNHDNYKGKIYAYNYETEKLDQIFAQTSDVMKCEDLECYLSEMNEMKIVYEKTDEEADSVLPVLSVWMKKNISN